MRELIWDDWNIEHIKKHKVTKDEVEEVYNNWQVEDKSYKKRKEYFGVTAQGRLLIVVVSYKGEKSPYVVSARDMSRAERKTYYEKTKTN